MTPRDMRRSDAGAATVVAVGLAALLVGVGLALVGAGSVMASQVHVQHVADVAALAAGEVARDQRALGVLVPGERPTGEPCARAAEVAHRNGLALSSCHVGAHGTVTVTVDALHLGLPIRATAAAGTGASQ